MIYYWSEKIRQSFHHSQNNLFLNHPSAWTSKSNKPPQWNLTKEKHNPSPVSFGKVSAPQLVLDSSLGYRDKGVRVQVFIMILLLPYPYVDILNFSSVFIA